MANELMANEFMANELIANEYLNLILIVDAINL